MNVSTPLAADLLRGASAAAAYVGVDPRVIYHMSSAGTLPAIRKGRALFFRKSDLEAAFQVGAVTAPVEPKTAHSRDTVELRDLFAAHALPAALAQAFAEEDDEEGAGPVLEKATFWAFEIADMMLARRASKGGAA